MTDAATLTDTRETLRRFDRALWSVPGGKESRVTGDWDRDLQLVSRRFRGNHRITESDPLFPSIKAIFEAHAQRVAGRTSATICAEEVRKVLAA